MEKGLALLGAVVRCARGGRKLTEIARLTRKAKCDSEPRGVAYNTIVSIEKGDESQRNERTLRVLAEVLKLPEWILLRLGNHDVARLFEERKLSSRPERGELVRCLSKIQLDEGKKVEVVQFFEDYCFPWVPAPGTPALVVSVADLMAEVRLLQGRVVSKNAAHQLAGREHAALRRLLAKADEPELRPLWDSALPTEPTETEADAKPTEVEADAKPTLPGFVRRVLANVRRFRADAGPVDRVGAAIINMVRDLRDAWGRIPYDDPRWSLDDQLFAELVLGLAYVETAIHVARTVRVQDQDWQDQREALFAPSLDTASYANGLRAAFDGHKFVLERVNNLFAGKTDELWLRIWGAMEQGRSDHKGLPDALKSAVSLRCTTPDLPPTTTAAQCFHWLGWGGDGQIFDGLATGSAPKNALLDVLGEKRYHAFNWHNVQKGDDSIRDPFESRQKHFGETALALLRYAARCTAALLLCPALRAAEGPVRIWADAVGPAARTEKMIYTATELLLGEDTAPPRFRLVLTDVSPFSLHELSKKMGPTQPFDGAVLLWRDLNAPFPGEPGEEIPTELAALLRPDTYDGYSCSVALHQVAQIADGGAGLARLKQILRFAVRLVRPGGIISLPDVGPGVHMQVYLLPVNICDREGNWGPATFFDRHSFSDVACRLRDAEPFDANAADEDDEPYKIPIPLLDLRAGTPECLADEMLFIYEYVPYLVVQLSRGELRVLDEDWRTAPGLRARQQLVRDELRRRWPKVAGLQQQIKARLQK